MSLAPSPSSSRGEIILQPAYFTSSAFVIAARADVDRLIQEYAQQYTRSAHSRSHPFTLFKEIWQRQGWTWIQFKVFDTRSRAAFLRVVMRLFSGVCVRQILVSPIAHIPERIGDGVTPLSRAAALFGLYTIFHTQPSTSTPSLYSAAQVELTCDVYEKILMLPDALGGEFLLPIRPHVVYAQSSLLQAQAIQILPHTETCPLSPRGLPREVVAEDIEGTPMWSAEGRKKKGRPSKRERMKKARDSAVALEGWCEGDVLGSRPSATRGRYLMERSALVDAVGRDERWEAAWTRANVSVVERMGELVS